MQRGIISLTKNEARLAELLAQNSPLDLTSFRAKILLVLNSTEDLNNLEVNRDEVEALLDTLPAPSPNQDQNHLLLRGKLQSFLVVKN